MATSSLRRRFNVKTWKSDLCLQIFVILQILFSVSYRFFSLILVLSPFLLLSLSSLKFMSIIVLRLNNKITLPRLKEKKLLALVYFCILFSLSSAVHIRSTSILCPPPISALYYYIQIPFFGLAVSR